MPGITSAVSAEGKTSTIVRLGVAFANLDRRVLMIDADMVDAKIWDHDRMVGMVAQFLQERGLT